MKVFAISLFVAVYGARTPIVWAMSWRGTWIWIMRIGISMARRGLMITGI